MDPSKQQIRSYFLEKRRALNQTEREKQGEAIFEKLKEWIEFQSAKCVAVYRAREDEVPTEKVFEYLFAHHQKVVAPRVVGEHIEWLEVTSLNDFERGAFGIQEPKMSRPKVAANEPDLILVPGVAFTLNGHRIGFGKGHYDRLLASSSAVKVGLAFSEQIASTLPQESHDIPLDFIFTP